MQKINHLGMIPYTTLPLFKGDAERLLQQAIAHGHGEATLDNVLDQLSDMRLLAFGEVVDNKLTALVTVKVVDYPQLRALHIAYGAGKNLAKLLPVIKDFCREQRISRIEVWCRESVARLHRKHGFNIGYYVPVLEI